jgi:hypothetical protein
MQIPLSVRCELRAQALIAYYSEAWEIVHPGPCHCEYCLYQAMFHAALMAVAVPVVSPLLEVPR